jgi:hypothetical protein
MYKFQSTCHIRREWNVTNCPCKNYEHCKKRLKFF